MMRRTGGYFIAVLLFAGMQSYGQQNLNLAGELQEKRFKTVNRTLSIYDSSPGAVEMNAAGGDGLAILQAVSFESGSLEVELLGENSPGRSFIGIAFNIQDDETYEAIYFRPFNFVAAEAIRKVHMVQYIAHPGNTWSRLREERTGEFENEIPVPPDPDDWFKAVIQVSGTAVEVFVNDRPDPVLKVERLSKPTSDKIGLWVGNGSSGRFRNLVL